MNIADIFKKYESRAKIAFPEKMDDEILKVYALLIGIDSAMMRDIDFFAFKNDVYPKDPELALIIDYLTSPAGRTAYNKWLKWVAENIPNRNLFSEKLHNWINHHTQA